MFILLLLLLLIILKVVLPRQVPNRTPTLHGLIIPIGPFLVIWLKYPIRTYSIIINIAPLSYSIIITLTRIIFLYLIHMLLNLISVHQWNTMDPNIVYNFYCLGLFYLLCIYSIIYPMGTGCSIIRCLLCAPTSRIGIMGNCLMGSYRYSMCSMTELEGGWTRRWLFIFFAYVIDVYIYIYYTNLCLYLVF